MNTITDNNDAVLNEEYGVKERTRHKLEEKYKKAIQAAESCKKAIEQLNNINYDKGDLVYSKLYGLCIVMQVNYFSEDAYLVPNKNEAGIKIQVAHKDGISECRPEDLVLKTNMAEILYEKI